MPDIFDFDNGNGVYDVVTRRDYERWEEEKREDVEKKNQEMTSEENQPSPFSAVPF